MSKNEDYIKLLRATLEEIEKNIKDEEGARLKSSFNKFLSSFNIFFQTLSSEKIISKDPYSQEYELADLNYPDTAPIPLNEEEYMISIRLSYYSALLNYMKDENIIDFENFMHIMNKHIVKLFSFLEWDRLFDPQPTEVNTAALNKLLFFYQKERPQQYIISSIKTCLNDINIYSTDLIKNLNSLHDYYNEKYKLFIREDVISTMQLPQILKGTNIKKAHDKISAKVIALKQPLFIELIGEILKEDFKTDGDTARKKVIAKLTKTEEIESTEEENSDPIDIFKKSLLELSIFSSQIDSLVEKLTENSIIYRKDTASFFDKIFDYIKYTLLSNKRVTILNIPTTDKNGENTTNKEIKLEDFIISLKILHKKLKNYKNTESEGYIELFSKDEEHINIEIHQLLSKSRYIYKIVQSLDVFFKKETENSKGLQIELKVILSAINSSQNLYFEYQKVKSETKTTYKPDTIQAT